MAVNIFGKNNNEKTGLETNNFLARPYQKEAISTISDFVKNLLRGLLSRNTNSIFKNAVLLNMATGSGKTFTLGKSLDKIIKIRNYYNKINKKNEFENLNIVVLTHRIDLVNQLRDDLVFGRDDKKAILSPEILENLHISTYHSKADEDDNILDDEELDLGNGTSKDKIIFSTHQTAGLIGLVDKLDYVDIILIDESHNIRLDSAYFEVLKNLSKKSRFGNESLIIPVTATPNNHTTKLFGNRLSKSKRNLEKLSNKLTIKENIINFFKTFKETEEKSYEYWINFNDEEISQIKYNGIKIYSLRIKSGCKNINHLRIKTSRGFQEFINYIFDKKNENRDKEKIINYFKTIKKTEEESYKYWINLTRKKITGIEYEGSKIIHLGKISLWNNINNLDIRNPKGFQEFINYIFDKESENLTKENIIKYFKTIKKTEEQSYEYLIKLNRKEIQKIEYLGNKITKLCNIYGFKNINNLNLQTPSGFKEFINHIFDKESENINRKVIILGKQEIINFFKTIKVTEEQSYEYLITLKQRKISDIEYKGNKIIKLGNICGWENINNLSLRTPMGLKQFINYIFNKKD